MKRLAILAAFAVVMGTSAGMALPCTGGDCAIDEPIVSTPPQQRMDPVETQIAGCGGRCARPEPDPDLWVTANTA